MKKVLLLLPAASILFFTACNSSKSEDKGFLEALKELEKIAEPKYNSIKIADQYSMDIEDGLLSTTSLNDDASLQYNNLFAEKYIIVIDEPKQEFIDVYTEAGGYDKNKTAVENYSNVQLGSLEENVTVSSKSSLKDMTINGMKAKIVEVDAEVTGIAEPISYFLAYVEGKETLYTVMAWTLKSKRADFEKQAMHMLKSLKEI